MSNYYITTTLPYINAEPHIGFALEIIRADVLARWHADQGDQVFFNSGVDEHGLKIFRKAEELGISTQDYCDQMADKFQQLKSILNLSFNSFIRTTSPHHEAAAQEFWRRCQASGDIYKKNYQVKYCVGCELEKTESELIDGHCPVHPNQDLELIDEENYFFRFSKYQEQLLQLYRQSDFVVPASRLHEITRFVERGLEDFSISRLKSKMPWGVSVPGDDEQIMYVWFDALVNYISCLGWPQDLVKFEEFWPGVQICGKDNLRQQSAMWQAMLMSAGLPNSRQILVNGFITASGQKMSKSLGNVVNPAELVDRFGSDALRYYLLSEITLDDGDYSLEKFVTKYNADLANGLGNLVARVANLLEINNIVTDLKPNTDQQLALEVAKQLQSYNFSAAMFRLWQEVARANEIITKTKPWAITDRGELTKVLVEVAQIILNTAWQLRPFLPEVADKIVKNFTNHQIIKGEALFQRLA